MSDKPVARSVSQIPGTFIHLGTPGAEQIAACRTRKHTQCVFVVPRADAAARLERELAPPPALQVVHAAIAAKEGEGALQCWSMARLDGLVEPTAQLHELYPSLRLHARIPVPLLTPAGLMDRIGAPVPPVQLVIDAPGSEFAILQAWEAAGLLDDVAQLDLRIAEAVLFQGAAPRAEVEAWLVARGFTVTARDMDDPEWPGLSLRADPIARRLAQAEAKVAELETVKKDHHDMWQARDKAREDLAKTEAGRKAAEGRVAELEKTLGEVRSQLEAASKARGETEAGRKAAEGRVAELETELETVKKDRHDMWQARDKARAEQAKAEAGRKAAEDRAAELEKARGEAECRRDKALDDLGTSIRFQGLLQRDLNDLRERFGFSEDTRRAQEDLLRKLTPRLQEAAEQLRQMQLIEGRDTAPSIAEPTARTAMPVTDPRARTKKASNATPKLR